MKVLRDSSFDTVRLELVWAVTLGSCSGRWGGGGGSSCCRWTSYGGTSRRTGQFDIAEWETLTLRLLFYDKLSIDIAKICIIAVWIWPTEKVSFSLYTPLHSADVLLTVLLATTVTGDLADVLLLIHDRADVRDISFRISVGS